MAKIGGSSRVGGAAPTAGGVGVDVRTTSNAATTLARTKQVSHQAPKLATAKVDEDESGDRATEVDGVAHLGRHLDPQLPIR